MVPLAWHCLRIWPRIIICWIVDMDYFLFWVIGSIDASSLTPSIGSRDAYSLQRDASENDKMTPRGLFWVQNPAK